MGKGIERLYMHEVELDKPPPFAGKQWVILVTRHRDRIHPYFIREWGLVGSTVLQ